MIAKGDASIRNGGTASYPRGWGSHDRPEGLRRCRRVAEGHDRAGWASAAEFTDVSRRGSRHRGRGRVALSSAAKVDLGRECLGQPRSRRALSLQLVEVLTSVLAAGRIDGALRVERSHPVRGQLGHACISLLGDPHREFGCRPRCDGMDDRAGRIGEPVTLRFGVGRDPRLATIDLVREDEHPVVPVRQVTEHPRDRPVLVGRRCESIVVEPVDERPEPFALAVVGVDVGAIVRHHCVLPSGGSS